MKLCPMCIKIKDIREVQGKDYYYDLCPTCRKKIRGKNRELINKPIFA